MRLLIITNAKIDAIQKKKIFVERGNVRNQVDDIDTIVVAVGYQAVKMKRATEKGQSLQVFNIGSMVTAKNALEAIHSGFHLGISI